MTNAILRGKPDAGNPHVRFDEGEVASAKPRRGSLLYKMRELVLATAVAALGATLAQTDATGPKDELTWHDAGAFLCGRGFAHTTHPYGRLDPADTNRLTEGVRWHGLDSAGLCLRFRTDSRRLAIRWRLMKTYEGGNMVRQASLAELVEWCAK